MEKYLPGGLPGKSPSSPSRCSDHGGRCACPSSLASVRPTEPLRVDKETTSNSLSPLSLLSITLSLSFASANPNPNTIAASVLELVAG